MSQIGVCVVRGVFCNPWQIQQTLTVVDFMLMIFLSKRERKESLANLSVTLDTNDIERLPEEDTTRYVYEQTSPSLSMCSETEQAGRNSTSSESDSVKSADSNSDALGHDNEGFDNVLEKSKRSKRRLTPQKSSIDES